jgi:hypothetical protein
MQDIVDMLQALPDAVTPGPAGPDLAAADVARGHRALRQRRHRRLAGVAGTVAVGAAAVVLVATSAPRSAAPAAGTAQAGRVHPASAGTSAGPAAAQLPLVTLAANVAAEPSPPGDATLVERETGMPVGASVKVWDLYTDDGRYFFSRTKAGLPAQVTKDNNEGDGQFGREVTAAIYAVKGDLGTAALKMAWPFPTPVPAWLSAQVKTMSVPAKVGASAIDNYVWENCQDALVAGSGNPQVRAGVLHLVSALPGITVTHGTADGQPTLTLTAGAGELGRVAGKPDKANPKGVPGAAYHESITINADTGIPLGAAAGPTGKVVPGVTYVVTRVSLASIAAGKF